MSRRSFFRLAVLTTVEALLFPTAIAAGASSSARTSGLLEEVVVTVESTRDHVMQWLVPEIWIEKQLFSSEKAEANAPPELPPPEV